MYDFQEEFFQVMSRLKSNSRAASVVGQECQMRVGNNPNRDKSNAASVVTGHVNKVKAIHDFIFSRGRII